MDSNHRAVKNRFTVCRNRPLCHISTNTLLRMCVLKHSKILRLPVLKECFNTLPSFIPQKELHPVGRPFAHVLSAGQVLVTYSHFAINDVFDSTSLACLTDACVALSSSCHQAIFVTALCSMYECVSTLLL